MASIEKTEDQAIQSLTSIERGVPRALVPTPTFEYHTWQRQRRLYVPGRWTGVAPAAVPVPIPIPLPLQGARVLMWKQDPTAAEIGIRKAFLPTHVFTGPRDARITSVGLPAVTPNVLGDPITAPGSDAFDAVHTFTVVRQTLTMYERALVGAAPWQWNLTPNNTDPLSVYAHAGVTMNAYYSRASKALKFFYFARPGSTPPEMIYTCRSLDIVSHETGHAILDGLKPGWLALGNPPQTGALHESFGDLTAIFLALSQCDQVEALIAQTKANLHDKSFLSDLAEQFGLALGRPNGLRNADNDLKLNEVSNEVHDLSQVFTGGIYDVLADIFAFERKPQVRDDCVTLLEAAAYLRSLLLRGIKAAPMQVAMFTDEINQMLVIAAADGKPVQYRNSIRNQFARRLVVVSPTPLTKDHPKGELLQPAPEALAFANAPQDRSGCCGTMRHEEYTGAVEQATGELLKELQQQYWSPEAR